MFDNDASSRPRLRRAAAVAVTAAAGAFLGAVLFWMVQFNEAGLVIGVAVFGLAIGFLKPPWPLVAVAAVAMVGTMTVLGALLWSSALGGLFFGVVYAFGFLVVMLIMTAVRARRSYVQRGWDLAFAEAREHDARVERAVAREREAMAGEIHDGLGHRLTLIAVQAARLSLDEGLPPQARAELGSIRANAAAAADELGETVGLLTERTADVTASLSGLGIEDVIERARASGVTVHSAVAPDVEGAANDYTRAALLRALQEGLTNAAKHAPGAQVHIAIDVVGDDVVLEMRNAVAPQSVPGPSGHGIVALRHRAAILGGTLEVDDGAVFALLLRLPRSSTPSSSATRLQPSRIAVLVDEAAGAERRHRLATRPAWMVPAAGLAVSTLVVVGYFVYHSVASVLPPERFATIEVGDTREETARVLPPTEDMLDDPNGVLPEPPGATCHYYEASVSFFERVDVYRVCFADDRVVATDTIPPS